MRVIDQIVDNPGWIDRCDTIDEGKIRAFGWARHPVTGGAASQVVLMDQDRRVLARAEVTEARTDVANAQNDRRLSQSGWEVVFSRVRLREGESTVSAYVVDPAEETAYRLNGQWRLVVDHAAEAVRQRRARDARRFREDRRRRLLVDRAMNERVNAEEIDGARTELVSHPTWVTLELTSRCNLECNMCFRHGMGIKGREVDPDLLEQHRRTFFPLARTISFDGSGEPMMYRGWDRLVEDVARWDFTPQINTNATLLTEERCRAVVEAGFQLDLSIDAATEETYRRIRGASLKKVLRNVDRLRAQRERVGGRFRMNVVFTPQTLNLRELPQMVDMVRDWGITRLIVNPWNPHVPNQEVSPDRAQEEANQMYLEALARATAHGLAITLPELYPLRGDEARRVEAIRKQLDGGDEDVDAHAAQASTKPGPHCLFPFNTAVVFLGGSVHPCCFGLPPYGNLRAQDFEAVWNGERWQELRRSLITGEGLPPACQGCFNRVVDL